MWFSISKNLALKINATEPSMAISTAIPKITFIGIPTTSKLKDGIVFIIIPNIMSDNKERAISGKAIVKPIIKIFLTVSIAYSKYAFVITNCPIGTSLSEYSMYFIMR